MRDGRKRADIHELPFTVAYGKNWGAEEAFRELESNTRDEGGTTYVPNSEWKGDPPLLPDRTLIIVDLPAFDAAYEKRDEIFLPGASRAATGILEAFPAEGEHIYYRGMRAYHLGKPSIFTYNVIEQQQLTEDRTIKFEFYIKQTVAEWVIKEANANQIEAILKADKDYWEFGLEFPSHIPPSDAFKEVMINRRKPTDYVPPHPGPETRPYIEGPINRNAYTYFAPVARSLRREEPKITYEAPWRLTDAHPRPWRLAGLEVQDANGNPVLAAPEGYYDEWDRVAEAIIKRVNIGMGS